MEVKGTFEIGDNHEEKLRELMLYIAKKCATHGKFGGTKQNKILFYSDFNAYRILGKPITGTRYRRQQFGPVAARYVQARNTLVSEGRAKVEETIISGFYPQKRLVALGEPNLELFSATEIAFVDQVIEELKQLSADEVSAMSHGRAWQAAGSDYADLPYQWAFISDEKLTPEENDRFKELVISKGWDRETANA